MMFNEYFKTKLLDFENENKQTVLKDPHKVHQEWLAQLVENDKENVPRRPQKKIFIILFIISTIVILFFAVQIFRQRRRIVKST